ncbi:hypothetical protein [Flavobacterium sp. I3-2]|uniref:hypothetical protein n=1 Tax=Flavobacterium sp. I3-2 TaxID=2748319 RepID=UPI0015AF1FDB|nr:hypothetical protein [Flavobacterium sp. I3-2]
MKYLIKIYFLLITLNVFGQTMYEASRSNSTILSSIDTPVNYVTGIPDINIDLFNVPTVNSNFNLNLNLNYDLYSNSSAQYTTNQFGDTWRLSILPKITRISNRTTNFHYGQEPKMTDEKYYENNLNNDLNYPDTFNYDIFGLSGKFYLKKENNNFIVQIIEQNDFAKINAHINIESNVDGFLKFKTNSFSITDKNGLKYDFELFDYYIFEGSEKYTTDFHLTKITDKYNNLICDYEYEIYGSRRLPSPITKNYQNIRHRIKKITINKIGSINFSRITTNQDQITFIKPNNSILKNILLNYNQVVINTSNGDWSKKILKNIEFYNISNYIEQKYTFEYNTREIKNIGLTPHGFLVNLDPCFSSDYAAFKENLYFDHLVLKKIKYPTGGCVFFEFEPNDFNLSESFNSGELNIFLQRYKQFNSENFVIENVPLEHDPLNNRYKLNYQNFENSDGFVYVNYAGTYYNDNNGIPTLPGQGGYNQMVFPKLKIYGFFLNADYSASFGSLQKTLTQTETLCNLGYRIPMYNTKYSLVYDAGHLNSYSSITAKAKIYNEGTIQKHLYANGLRIKKITTFDSNVKLTHFNNGINSEIPTNQVAFNYKKFNDVNSSSGQTKHSSIDSPSNDYELKNYSDLILYKNVSIKTSGLGSIEYTFDNPNYTTGSNSNNFPNNSFIKKLPTKIVKKDETGNIVEENIFSRTFKEFNPNASGINKQPIITYEKVINRNYVNGNSTPLELITESTFDTISRNLTSKKIINSLLNETFEEQYTYVKHNDSYLPKTINKFKNGIALNRSENFYSLKKCAVIGRPVSSLYNLIRTEIAKANLPLEIENEYTVYSCDGKLQEYKTKDGVYVSQIWGYNGAFVIAELHNIRYSEINVQTLTNLISASNLTDLNYNENNIRNFVDNLRTTHPDAKIKSYTFNPLVGMTSMTDVNGRDEFYEYDIFNRLYRIKDHSGLILKEYNYNYKN